MLHFSDSEIVPDFPQVHPYAKLPWSILNAAQRVHDFLGNPICLFIQPQVVIAQMDRDERVRGLWNKVGDILDLVDPLGEYKDHRLYKKNVEAILKQVYECVLFLRWYADKGFTGLLSCPILSSFALIIFPQSVWFVMRFLNEPKSCC
jgi:hypothetical protein